MKKSLKKSKANINFLKKKLNFFRGEKSNQGEKQGKITSNRKDQFDNIDIERKINIKNIKKHLNPPKHDSENDSEYSKKIRVKNSLNPSQKTPSNSNSSEEIEKAQTNFDPKRKRKEQEKLPEEIDHLVKKRIIERSSPSNSNENANESKKSKEFSLKISTQKKMKQTAVKSAAPNLSQCKYKQNIPSFPYIIPKEKGNFIYGDKANKIVKTCFMDDELICEIEWLERKNGEKPLNSRHSNTFIKEFDPLLLVNFYEPRIKESSQSNK